MKVIERNNENETYICSVICNKTMVNVFLDDYGQQYFYQYVDKETGKLVEVSCGSYQTEYLEQIEHDLNYDAWFSKQSKEYQEMIIEGRKRAAKCKLNE